MRRTVVMTLGEEDIVFFYYVGCAIEAWATAENMLRRIVMACIPPGPDDITQNSVSVGFNSIDSFRAKMDFTEAIVERRFPPDVRADWAKLVRKARELSWQRNKIAHWRTALYDENMPGRRYMLVPWVIPKPKKNAKRPKPPSSALALKDIWKLHREFIVLAKRLENFAAHLRGAKEPYPESQLQLAHPPTTAKLRDQILEEFRLQLSPSEESPPPS